MNCKNENEIENRKGEQKGVVRFVSGLVSLFLAGCTTVWSPVQSVDANALDTTFNAEPSSRYVYMWIASEYSLSTNSNQKNRYLVISD